MAFSALNLAEWTPDDRLVLGGVLLFQFPQLRKHVHTVNSTVGPEIQDDYLAFEGPLSVRGRSAFSQSRPTGNSGAFTCTGETSCDGMRIVSQSFGLSGRVGERRLNFTLTLALSLRERGFYWLSTRSDEGF